MQKILIKTIELKKLILKDHENDIDHKGLTGAGDIFAGLVLILPIIHQRDSIEKRFILMIGAMYCIFGGYLFFRSIVANYKAEDLYKDILSMNNIRHKFSLVAVRNNYSQHPNKYLLHYDERWKCYLFFSYKTSDIDDEKNIISMLSGDLNIDKNVIHASYEKTSIDEKYSYSDKIRKTYEHRYYIATIDDFPDIMKNKEFELGGIHYKWMSFQEMDNDKEIEKKNSDIVGNMKDVIANLN